MTVSEGNRNQGEEGQGDNAFHARRPATQGDRGRLHESDGRKGPATHVVPYRLFFYFFTVMIRLGRQSSSGLGHTAGDSYLI